MSDEQLTVDGRTEPMPEPEPSGKHEQDRLFMAPETVPGQLAMETDRKE